MRHAHRDDPVPDLRARHCRLHAWGDVDRLLAPPRLDRDRFVPDGHPRAPATSRRVAMRAMSAAVALPPLTTRTVRCPRGSTFPARTAASGAEPDGSAKTGRASG